MAGAIDHFRGQRGRHRGAHLHLVRRRGAGGPACRAAGRAEAQVTEDIDNIHGKGAVVIRGMAWSARSQDGGPIAAGTLVRVLRIEGVKVFVEPTAAPVSAGEPKNW